MTRREKGVHRYNLKQDYGWKNNLGWGGLHWVVFHGCEGWLEHVNTADIYRETALMMACQLGHNHLVRRLCHHHQIKLMAVVESNVGIVEILERCLRK